MKLAVVTLCIGSNWNKMAELTHPTIKNYSNRIGADFIVMNSEVIKADDHGFEKFQLANILQYYDRVLYLDTDLIISKHCPNLFDIVPFTDLGCFIESNYWMCSSEVDHRERIKLSQEKLGNIGWVTDYFNTGVMILSKRHIPIFEIPSQYIIDLREQTQLNYNTRKYGFWLHDIGLRFNKMDFINPLDRFDSYIIHYAGKGFTPIFHEMSLKIQQISNDIEAMKNLGTL